MKTSNYIKISSVLVLLGAGIAGCTKLNESYTTTIPKSQADILSEKGGPGLLLNAAYVDLIQGAAFVNQDGVFSLTENSTDESLVVTRGGDWDDNGVWRVIHNHSWNADHAQVLSVFNQLGKINYDATNVLNFKPSKDTAAQARFIRAYALYFQLDLYNQFPFREPGSSFSENPTVKTGAEAVQYLIDELTAIIGDLNPANGNRVANVDAAKALLMKVYLNKGAFLNRASPTFDDADMQQVIQLGNDIINSGKYSYEPNYFDNFDYNNNNSKEAIWMYASPGSGNSTNNPGLNSHYEKSFHYNQYSAQAPGSGWNGFTTMSTFYQSFGVGQALDYSLKDTQADTRIGRRYTSNIATVVNSGIRAGFLVGQQFDKNGTALKDRKGAPLAYDPVIAEDMVETGSNLEVTGIRVAKYVPDFSDPSGAYYSNNPGNSVMFLRYPDVVLMVAEAKMRASSADAVGALALVNGLRLARGAAALTGPLVLLNTSDVEDPNTLLAERGREFYWEQVRRTDLIRFGAFLLPWQYKPASGNDPKYLLFPIPTQALSINPNLIQNPGY